MSDQAHPSSLFGATPGRLLLAIAAVAVIVGVVVRFKGLGTWPFGADEYYFAQSVQNILRAGLPEYQCGGFYVRGIVLQYLAAGLQLLGLSPELAPRAIAAVSSLLALPAAYLIGRRLNGASVGLLAVVLLSLSVWEVDMGRFGRMYAPFQAVFLWYLVYFLRFTVDRQSQALRGMVLLTVLGVLVWEGGFLLIGLNLLPPFINHGRGRLTREHWRYLGLMGLLMLPLSIYFYWSTIVNIRFTTDVPALPPDFDEIVAQGQSSDATGPSPLRHLLADEPLFWVLGLIPLALAGWALPWILGFRHRWLAAAGLLVALAAAFAHQFLVFFAALALLLIARIVDWRELLDPRALRFHVAVASTAAFWILFGVLTDSWFGGAPRPLNSTLVAFVYQFFGFPAVLDMVARPWARAVPWLALSIFLMLTASAIHVIFKEVVPSAERAMLIAIVVMMLMIGIGIAPRLEMRYTFFLYPLLLVIGISLLVRGIEKIRWRFPGASLLGPAVVLGWFVLTEDFQPGHLLRIDSTEVNLRRDKDSEQGSHYQVRGNIRATAEWLRAHARSSTDLVVSGPGVTALDAYYPAIDFVFVDPSDHRLYDWSCQRGTVERWSNLPLVYTASALESRISAHPRSYIVVDSRRAGDFVMKLRQFSPRIVWANEYGSDVIVLIDRAHST